MKRLLDINTWIALTLEQHPHHGTARNWHEEAALSRGDLVFCMPTEIGFLRLITQEAVMNRCGVEPLSNAEAIDYLGSLVAAPVVSRVEEPAGMRPLWLQLAHRPQASPMIWMDAYLAAFAITFGAEMVTFDRGFQFYQKSGLKLRLLEAELTSS